MSNKDRIADLEREVDQLHTALARLSDRVVDLGRLLTPPPPKRSLADQAKARAAGLGDRVLRAVGL